MTPRLLEDNESSHLLNTHQLHTWQQNGCPVIAYDITHGWRLGIPSTGHSSQLQSLLTQLLSHLAAWAQETDHRPVVADFRISGYNERHVFLTEFFHEVFFPESDTALRIS